MLEVSQFMWQPFSTVIHAAVKTKKKIWQTQFAESQRELWEKNPDGRGSGLSAQPAGGSELRHVMSLSDWSLLSPLSDETLTST